MKTATTDIPDDWADAMRAFAHEGQRSVRELYSIAIREYLYNNNRYPTKSAKCRPLLDYSTK